MTVFEYVAAFVAIVMGLSVARVMSGIGAFILLKSHSPKDWLVFGWCIALIVTQIGWWMLGWFTVGQLETVTYFRILAWFTGTALLYLAGYLLVPETSSPSIQPSSAKQIPAAFFACISLHFLLPIGSAIFQGTWSPIMWLLVFMVVLSSAGAFLHNVRFHTILFVFWFACMSILNFIVVPAVGENSGSVLVVD